MAPIDREIPNMMIGEVVDVGHAQPEEQQRHLHQQRGAAEVPDVDVRQLSA